MIDADLVQPLLRGLEPDEDPLHRRLLLRTLAALPLSAPAWRLAAPVVLPTTSFLMQPTELDASTCALLARVPLRSVRVALRRVASDSMHPQALTAALALAEVRDAGGLATLLQVFSKKPTASLAATLAALPLEELAVGPANLAPGVAPAASGEEPEVAVMRHVWSAIALARCDDMEPLEQLWDALVQPPAFFARRMRPVLFRVPPALFCGDPPRAMAELARVRPIPERLRQFLSRLQRSLQTQPDPRNQARQGLLLVDGLLGTDRPKDLPHAVPASSTTAANAVKSSAVRVAMRLLQSPWRGNALACTPDERLLLRHVPALLSARVIEAGVDALGQDLPALRKTPVMHIGQALVDLASALPTPLPLRVASLLQKPHVDMLPVGALAWTLARAGAATALQALSPHILGGAGRDRTLWLNWLARIAEQLDAPVPGRDADLPVPPFAPIELVDDVSHAGRPRPAQGAPTAEANETPATVARTPRRGGAAPLGAAPQMAPQHQMALPPQLESPPCTLYPDIRAEELHPVAGAAVQVTVALMLQALPDTLGAVQIPGGAPETEYTLKVHLLFGNQSAWSTLVCSAARGTVTQASFTLPAPAITGERTLIALRANFYLNQRWCGEGQRLLDVRRNTSVPPLPAIPRPDASCWRHALRLDPRAMPPDLIVRIQKGATGEYLWSCLSPHLDFPEPATAAAARTSFGQDAATFVRQTFAPMAGRTLNQLDIAEVCGAGEAIYNNTPQHFRDSYWALWRAAQEGAFSFDSIQIVTDEPCVPWELMRLSDPTRAPGVEPEFLSIRHSVGRWLAGESSAMLQRIPVRKLAVAASDYAGLSAGVNPLPWAAKERELLVGTYRAEPVTLKSDSMLAFLEAQNVQAAHFACHGKMSISDPDASLLVMEDSPANLKPRHVARREVCDGLGSQHPLIFLNACEVGGSAASLSLVAGFPAAFLYAGAAALVSPLWAVNDAHAHRIAEDFYRQVFVAGAGAGKPLGAVLRDVRARWKTEAHLTFLAYVLYGDPLAHVSYEPAA